MDFPYKTAFTLSEVLITIGIIGIVAAMTIPTVLQNQREKETVAKLKKAYSTLSNAFTLAVQEDGEPTTWDLVGFCDVTGAQHMLDKMAPYLNITKNCGGSTGCFPTSSYKNLNNTGTESINGINWKSKAQLKDGTLIAFFVRNANCTNNYGTSLQLQSVCGDVEVDINGLKEPNTFGKDLFRFHFTKYGIVPKGTAKDTGAYSSFANHCLSNNGEACTAWVIYNENTAYTKCSDLSWTGKTECN